MNHDSNDKQAVKLTGEEVAKLTYFGLFALQHRGQEAAGMAVSDGRQIVVFKDLGLVSQVFDEQTLSSLRGHLSVGHTRYSTTGSPTWENAQPTFRTTAAGTGLALAKLLAIGLGIILHLRRVHYVVAILTGIYVMLSIVPWTALLFLS